MINNDNHYTRVSLNNSGYNTSTCTSRIFNILARTMFCDIKPTMAHHRMVQAVPNNTSNSLRTTRTNTCGTNSKIAITIKPHTCRGP